MERKTKIKVITTAVLVFALAAIVGVSIWYSEGTPMGMDEYLFYRLAGQAPNYSADKDWFYEDRPELLEAVREWDDYDLDEALSTLYDSPIFRHPPLPIYLTAPLVKGLDYLAEEGYIKPVEGNFVPKQVEGITRILRLFMLCLSLLSFWLIYRLVKSKIGNYAFLTFVPIGVCYLIMSGLATIYWDVFIMFFFVLTLYLMETKPNSKWWYLTACCLVNTKMYIGLLFLLPLMLKNKKVALATLSIIPYWVATWIATGDPLWLFTSYAAGSWTYPYVYSSVLLPGVWTLIVDTNLWIYWLLTIMSFFLWKQYPAYVAFWVLTIIVGIGLGMTMWTMSAMLYSGALIFPFIVHKLGIFDFKKVKLAESK